MIERQRPSRRDEDGDLESILSSRQISIKEQYVHSEKMTNFKCNSWPHKIHHLELSTRPPLRFYFPLNKRDEQQRLPFSIIIQFTGGGHKETEHRLGFQKEQNKGSVDFANFSNPILSWPPPPTTIHQKSLLASGHSPLTATRAAAVTIHQLTNNNKLNGRAGGGKRRGPFIFK